MKDHQRHAVAEAEATPAGQEAAVKHETETANPLWDAISQAGCATAPATGTGGDDQLEAEADAIAEQLAGERRPPVSPPPEPPPANGDEGPPPPPSRTRSNGNGFGNSGRPLPPGLLDRVQTGLAIDLTGVRPLVVWTASQATAMLQMAGRHLGYEAGDA